MKIEDWETLDYRKSWLRQKQIFKELIENKSIEEKLIMVEHPPVYTLGFHGNRDNLLVPEEKLQQQAIEIVRIERGGDITYHGPGQLVIYPIIRLSNYKIGVKQYVHILEQSVIQLLMDYDIESECDDSAIGVWLDVHSANARKICAIGIKVSHGITMHGLALNVNTDLNAFKLINPCGFKDKGVTSIAKELGCSIAMKEIKEKLSKIIITNLKGQSLK